MFLSPLSANDALDNLVVLGVVSDWKLGVYGNLELSQLVVRQVLVLLLNHQVKNHSNKCSWIDCIMLGYKLKSANQLASNGLHQIEVPPNFHYTSCYFNAEGYWVKATLRVVANRWIRESLFMIMMSTTLFVRYTNFLGWYFKVYSWNLHSHFTHA